MRLSPIEKAQEFTQKFSTIDDAITCVKEILEARKIGMKVILDREYWEEVQLELIRFKIQPEKPMLDSTIENFLESAKQ